MGLVDFFTEVLPSMNQNKWGDDRMCAQMSCNYLLEVAAKAKKKTMFRVCLCGLTGVRITMSKIVPQQNIQIQREATNDPKSVSTRVILPVHTMQSKAGWEAIHASMRKHI